MLSISHGRGILQDRSFAERIQSGERRALAKAITLVESSRPEHRDASAALLDSLVPPKTSSVRVGISGPPGVGKSTFIEAFGLHAIEQGHRVAVLSVDPTSRLSGGSILGDKTRMQQLGRHPDAYIRPTPAGTTLGGVARRTRETMTLCEAAGFDFVIVETVGVGQSETACAEMTDIFLVLLLPLGGDELQGIKRGIMELADVVLVNKADGAQADAAQRTVAEYRNGLRLLRPRSPHWTPVVEACSALFGNGIDLAWTHVFAHREAMLSAGAFHRRRAQQAIAWMRDELNDQLHSWLMTEPSVAEELARCERLVSEGAIAPPAAARRILTRALPK